MMRWHRWRRQVEDVLLNIIRAIKNDRRRLAAIEAHLGLTPPPLVKE
jgi:hypothetical protein